MGSRIIALDADGVLLDYHLAYANAWQRAFGVYPQENDPDAYWPMDRWAVQRLTGEPLEIFRRSFDELFWAGVPAIEGAVQACHALTNAGHELVCVSALPAKFRGARERNLRQLGFPIETAYATDNTAGPRSPKADLLHTIRPLAFVDDFLPYLVGVDGDIHSALIMRGANGSPNQGERLALAASQHGSLLEFSHWWNERSAQGTSPVNAGAIR